MTDSEQIAVWKRQLAENVTLAEFNRYVVPVMRSDEQFKALAAAEAKRRGYKADKALGVYVQPIAMHLLKNGRVIIKVGWQDGTMYAEYANGKVYTFPGWAEEELVKLRHSPYSDSLFLKLKAKYEKIATAKTLQGGDLR